jgi:hypothetical protein
MVKQSKNAGNTEVRSYIGNGVGNYWFAEKGMLDNTVSGAWKRWKYRQEVEFPKECSEEKRPRNMKPQPGAGRGDVKEKDKRKKGK